MIRVEATTRIARPPARVFAILDDFARAPEWNDRCVEMRQLGDGARGRGVRMVYRYRYRERGSEGEIQGEISDYERDRKLAMRYADHALDIHVAFELVADDGGTRLDQVAEIAPKSLVVRLMAPIIRRAARRQCEHMVDRLKTLAEA
jgi:uncharacterized protein YndB with AHSA1/START domain